MRQTTEFFKINGVPLLVPDAPVQITEEEIQSSESGRDESGLLHRFALRRQQSWKFTYRSLTDKEKQYMLSLFPETDSFTFTHPGRVNAKAAEESLCYRSDHSIAWRNARTGLWSELSFRITQC